MFSTLENNFAGCVCIHFRHVSQSQVTQGEALYICTTQHIWCRHFRRTYSLLLSEGVWLAFITLRFFIDNDVNRKNCNLESHSWNTLCINQTQSILFLWSQKLFLFSVLRNHPVVFFASPIHCGLQIGCFVYFCWQEHCIWNQKAWTGS